MAELTSDDIGKAERDHEAALRTKDWDERCGECRALIPGGEPSMQSGSHEGFCSLHPDNENDHGGDLDLPLVRPAPESLTHADLEAQLQAAYAEYDRVLERIAKLSLVDVLVITRRHFPTAAFVEVDSTDQDMSGALVTDRNGVFDAGSAGNADGTMLDSAGSAEWSDAVFDPLINLTDNVSLHRDPFIVETNTHIRRLDLDAIEAAIPNLLAGPTAPSPGLDLDEADGPLVIHGGLGALLAAIDVLADLNGSELDDVVAEMKGAERAEINNGGVHSQVRYLVSSGVHPNHLATLLNVEIGGK